MTDLITRETLGFIDAHREQPFLIYVAYNTPHYPMVAAGEIHQDVPAPAHAPAGGGRAVRRRR